MVDRGTFDINNLVFVDERIRATAPVPKNNALPESWTPGPWSVLCGRGKECYNHVGNRRFRVLVEINIEKYASAKSKMDKGVIVMSILDAVREGSNQMGGFVKQDPKSKRWVDVGDEVAREKIGQEFRVKLAQQKKSKKNIDSTEEGKRVPKSKLAAKRQRPSIVSTTSSSCEQPDIVVSQDETKEKEEEIITAIIVDEVFSNTSDMKELDSEPTPLCDEIANILEFELDCCNEDDLLHIIAVTA